LCLTANLASNFRCCRRKTRRKTLEAAAAAVSVV